jgi:glycosyltransferase involved in cell wall biosynthesis
MPQVLVMCEYASLNGGERSLLTLLEHGLCRDFDVRVACPSQGPLVHRLRTLGIPHESLDLHTPHGHRWELPECRRRLAGLLDRVRPDLVHANSLAISRLSGPVTADRALPSLGYLRDILRISRQVVQDLNRQPRLIAVSEATGRWYADLGVESTRMHVVYNGVDLQAFRPRSSTGYLHRELDLPPGTKLIASIGQIGMRKGLDTVLDAAGRVVQRQPDACFLVVGQRYSQKREAVEYESRLHAAACQPPLAGRVRFLGLRDDIPQLLNELTLLVHAARQEPLGRVLLEAAAAGVAVVATAVGGTTEIFVDGDSAALVPPDDHRALADATLGLLADPPARRRLAQNARRRAESRFRPDHAARTLAEHYGKLLLNPKGFV